MPILNYDLIDALINITPESTLADARKERSNATENTQAAFEAIFSAPSPQLTGEIKFLFARIIAEQTGSYVLADFYNQLLGQRSPNLNTPALQAAEHYLRILVSQPKQTHYSLIHALIEQGWHEADIILLAQLITFVTYQARLIEGLRLLQGNSTITKSAEPVTAGQWNSNSHTHQGQPAPTAFTQDQLGWESWLQARDPQTLEADEAQVMKKFGQLNSEYFLLLAHQSHILILRTLIDRGVFYTLGGLPRWEREFAAAAVSKVNGCIYCASVHARKASQYAKERKADVEKLIATPVGAILAEGFDDRLTAITDFTTALSTTPIRATHQQVETLRQLGLSELELLDLIQSTAFFSWANRLMLSLGEPFELKQDKE
ncbi:CMD domain-containing protein [Providencia stuartii]|uniref:CMD domain-containing protein n=1 Tax=Providencia stuartii TaxID=588 RepID=UPI003709E78C